MAAGLHIFCRLLRVTPAIAGLWVALLIGFASAIPLKNDPNGFRNIPWGASLADKPEFTLGYSGPNIKEYRLKDEPPRFADQDVEKLILSTVQGKFARVTIRYRGEQTHKHILQFLEEHYGRHERIPGQMTRGLNQQFHWRGLDTEINLGYEANLDRGYLFIESRNLIPLFQEGIVGTAE